MSHAPGASATVIAEGAAPAGQGVVVGRNAAALPGRDLFVWVEAEGSRRAPAARRLIVDRGPQGLAGIVDEAEVVRVGQVVQRGPVGRYAEHVDGQEGFRLGREGGLDGLHVEVVRLRVDVDEAGPQVFVQQHVRRGHEAERGGDHLGARGEVEGADDAVKCGRPAAHRHGVRRPAALGHPFLKRFDERAAREATGGEHRVHELFAFLRNGGLRKRDGIRHEAEATGAERGRST